ncbi:hypothetical protein D3C78_883920 [compost metagenome]
MMLRQLIEHLMQHIGIEAFRTMNQLRLIPEMLMNKAIFEEPVLNRCKRNLSFYRIL